MTIGTGIALFVIGAILAFAVHVQITWIDLNMVGYILMAAGVLGIIIGAIMLIVRRGRRGGSVDDQVL